MLDECVNVTVTPPTWTGVNLDGRVEDRCYRYNKKDPRLTCRPHYKQDLVDPDVLEKCDRWIYDTSTFKSTIVTEVSVAFICISNQISASTSLYQLLRWLISTPLGSKGFI